MIFQTHENVAGNDEAEYRAKVQAAIKKYTAVCFFHKLIINVNLKSKLHEFMVSLNSFIDLKPCNDYVIVKYFYTMLIDSMEQSMMIYLIP